MDEYERLEEELRFFEIGLMVDGLVC